MTDSAINASEKESSAAESAQDLLQRLETYKEDNPHVMEYWITDEYEAALLLTGMAASLKLLEKDVEYSKVDAEVLHGYACQYRAAVKQGRALKFLAELDDANALAVYGMRIRAKAVYPH